MKRGKVQVKRIENKVNRQVTISKRRGGLLKKARELAVLCDTHLGVVIFSSTGKLYEYCSPHTSELIQRYDSISNTQLQGRNRDEYQQMLAEIERLRRERDQLKATIRRQNGEDLSPLSTKELDNLRKQLESALGNVCARKDQLVNQQLGELHHKVHILEDHNSRLHHMINEEGHHRAAAEVQAADGIVLPGMAFGGFFPEVEKEGWMSLQQWPQQLPGVQGFGQKEC